MSEYYCRKLLQTVDSHINVSYHLLTYSESSISIPFLNHLYNGGGAPLAKHLNGVVFDLTAEVFDGSSNFHSGEAKI